MYTYFLHLEHQRVLLLNGSKLRKEKEKMVENARVALLENPELKEKWVECFSADVATSEHVS